MNNTSNVISSEQPIAELAPDPTLARNLVAAFGPVGYAYFGLGSVTRAADRAVRTEHLAVRLRAAHAPTAVVTAISDRIALAPHAGAATLAVFADAAGTVIGAHTLSDAVLAADHGRTAASADSSDGADVCGYAAPPMLLPLLCWQQNHPPYVLVTIDHTGADLTSCSGAGRPEVHQAVTGPDDEIERNAPGGWSQPRYQRRAEDSWRHNAARVASAVEQAIENFGAQVLLVSGDVRAVQLLREQLTHRTGPLIGQISGGRSPDGSQAHRALQLEQALRGAASLQNSLVLQRLHANLGPGGLAVQGLLGTVGALAAGRVALLVVTDNPTSETTAWYGPEPGDIYVNEASACRSRSESSGADLAEGPLVDVAVRAALLTGAQVRVLPAATVGLPVGGIGALCRFSTAG